VDEFEKYEFEKPLHELPPHLRARRAAVARRKRLRRRLAVLAVVAVIAGVVAVVVLSGGGGSEQAAKQAGGKAQPAPGGGNQGGGGPEFPADWRPDTGPVPILEYHAIQPPTPGAPYPQLFVPQADLQHQMVWLRDHGYEGVTLRQVEDSWYRGGELPPKPIVISFDDGYQSQFVAAFPLLRKLGWPGLLNLKASGADLTDAQAQQMADAGWEIASHTISHVDLTTVDSTQLQREVAGSRQILHRKLGVPIDNFCYPSGRYDAAVIAAVKKAGYVGATTTQPGLADREHPYTLDRIAIGLDDGVNGFVEKLQAAESGNASGIATTPGA
jgi:peptidoglycan/xylan/chitin deacetylase (PgdA/CDA1 family)